MVRQKTKSAEPNSLVGHAIGSFAYQVSDRLSSTKFPEKYDSLREHFPRAKSTSL
jgi:hypothetical protein